MKIIKRILYPICILCIVISAWNLWKIQSSTQQTKDLYDNLADQARASKEEEDASGTESGEKTEEDENSMQVYLTVLQKQNADVIGWIRIPGTVIDYPVMQTDKERDDYYLTHDFQQQENPHGAPFLDVNCQLGVSDNLIIYGHNMKDKTMFQNLQLFEDAVFCESNGEIEFDTLTDSSTYRVVFVMLITEKEAEKFPYHRCIDLSNDEIYQGYLQQCQRYAIWQVKELPKTGTDLLTLSTCEYSRKNGRLVIVAAKEGQTGSDAGEEDDIASLQEND